SRVANIDVEIKWERLGVGSGGGIEITIRIPDSGEHLTFRGKWGGTSSEIGGIVGSGDSEYFQFRLKPNDDVFKLDNEQHQRALSELTVIGSGLNNSSFVATSSVQLFPPPPKPTDELILRGSRDWVMFHSGRTKI